MGRVLLVPCLLAFFAFPLSAAEPEFVWSSHRTDDPFFSDDPRGDEFSAKVITGLKQRYRVEFREATAANIVEWYGKQLGVKARIDELDEEFRDATINFCAKRGTLGGGLDELCDKQHWWWDIGSEELIFGAGDAPLRTRVYPVGDLVQLRDGEGEYPEFQPLIDVLRSSVELGRGNWPDGIDYLPSGQSLVIKQTFRGHREIESLLVVLRKARAEQKITSPPRVRRTSIARPATKSPVPPLSGPSGIGTSFGIF